MSTVNALRVHEYGGPEVLGWEEVDIPAPGRGEVRIRHTAIGLNFIDVYQRTGLYPVELPMIPGSEAAGVVEELGPGVSEVRVGDRVAYQGLQGAYCEERNAPAGRLVKLPDEIPDEVAAAMMLKGMTAEYLLHRTQPVHSGDTIVFHAAAGGVGLIACQWANALGAQVIGVVGSEKKVELARSHGCHHVVVIPKEDLVERVKELTGGRGVPVVYDSVGKDTWEASLDCLAPRGMLVLFGQSSGKVPPFDPGLLAKKGSLFLTRPSLHNYVATREELEKSSSALFDVVKRKKVRVEINQRYPLREAARAHADLEGRRTTGSTILTV
jgi:NADPH2:quinone reductase